MTGDESEQPDQFTVTVQKSDGLVTRTDDGEVVPLWVATAPGVKNPPIGDSPEDALEHFLANLRSDDEDDDYPITLDNLLDGSSDR